MGSNQLLPPFHQRSGVIFLAPEHFFGVRIAPGFLGEIAYMLCYSEKPNKSLPLIFNTKTEIAFSHGTRIDQYEI